MLLWLLLVGMAAPGAVGATLLSSVGKQQRAVWVGLLQLGLYGILFAALWSKWLLWGAVVAYGVAVLAANLLLLFVARHSFPVAASIWRDYGRFCAVAVTAAICAKALRPFSLAASGPACLVCMA